MKANVWNRWRGLLLPIALLTVVVAMLFVWGAQARPAMADGEPWTAKKFAQPAEVPPGGTVKYSIVLSRSVGTLVTPIYISDHLDPALTFAGNVVVEPAGTPHGYDSSTPGYITFTLYNLSSVITMSFESTLSTSAVSGNIINNIATVNDGVNLASTNVATFTVSQPPQLQIYTPTNGQIIKQTQGTVLAVTGRAWGVFDPAPFPGAPTLASIDNIGGSGTYNVSWSIVDDAANYVLQESRSPDFSSVTTYAIAAPTTVQFVAGKTVGTYYYRVAAYNALARPSRWSNVQPVTVTSVSLLSEPLEGSAAAQNVAMPTSDLISVIVSTNGGSAWSVATVTENPGGWWDWTYNWTLPQAGAVPYPIIARAAYAGGGAYGQDTITVTIDNDISFVYLPLVLKRWPPIPYPPTLSNTPPDVNGNFTVSWTYGSYPNVPAPTSYLLQEATNASFTGATEYAMGLTMSKAFTTKSPATYYYRVRGKNSYGDGEWSNVIAVVVVTQNRIYWFDSGTDQEGWGVKRWDAYTADLADYRVRVMNGSLYTYLWGRYDEMQVSPLQEGPTVPYTVIARVMLLNETIDGYPYTPKGEQAYGILFGANNGVPCPADRSTLKGTGCLSHYYRVLVAYDMGTGAYQWSLKRIDYHDPNNGGKGDGKTLLDWRAVKPGDALGWNEWKITVTNDSSKNIKVYLNGNLIGEATDLTYVNERYFGTMMVSPAFGQVGAKWDWFKVQK